MNTSLKFMFILFSVLISSLFWSCDSKTSEEKIATITGRVVYQDRDGALHAIDSAIVKAEAYYTQTKTDNAGNFTLEVELDENEEERTVGLSIYKTGYSSTVRNVLVKGGETTNLAGQDIILMPTGGEDINFAIIQGFVYGGTSQNPLENATITFSGAEAEPVFSGIDGSYSYSYQLNDGITEKTISATFERSGYARHIETNVLIRANETTTIGNIVLSETNDTISAAGEPYAIQIESVGSYHIYVTESGLPEITDINVVVTDVRGLVIDDLHRIVVHYDLLNHPGDGVSLYPDVVETVGGKATAYLQAGTKAGAVQIRVWFERDDGFIAEVNPVQISIWGGFPVQDNFSLALEKVNIAGMRWTGLLDDVTAFMGDKYNNPVAPGTSVYFTTAYCYIEGSNNSDELGRATVQFVAAELRPDPSVHPDSAIVKVYAHTFGHDGHGEDDDYVMINAQTGIMLTGVTDYIQIIKQAPVENAYDDTHTIFDFQYIVQDIYTNPIVGNSSISVSSNIGSVSGDVSVSVNDTQLRGDGSTVYYFTWVAPDNSEEAWGQDAVITIKVTTPANGNGNRNEDFIVPFGG